MSFLPIEQLKVFRLAEELSDLVWNVAKNWPNLARDTVGKQLVRAADSVGDNIAEGHGRGSYQDNRRFIRIARGSLQETRYWLRRAHMRGLLNEKDTSTIQPMIKQLSPMLNAYLKSIGKSRLAESSPMTNDQ